MPNTLLFVFVLLGFVLYGIFSIKQGRDRLAQVSTAANGKVMKFRAISKFIIGGWCIFCAILGAFMLFTNG